MNAHCAPSSSPSTPPSPPPTSPSPAPAPAPSASAFKDPHLHFAHGGVADFRGKDGAFYVLLSAPGYHMAAQTRDVTHILPRPQLVHGSFFTRAGWTLTDRSGRLFNVTTRADEVSFSVSSGSFLHTMRGAWKEWRQGGLRVLYKQSTIVVRGSGWEVNCTRKPIYNHVSGGSKWRFDISMRPLDGTTGLEGEHGIRSPSCFPHGILGQSWDGDGVAVHGKRDDYTYNSSHAVVTTTANAEGAIEGDARMYELPTAHFTSFRFSRFNRRGSDDCLPRNVSALLGAKVAGRASAVRSTEVA